MKKCPTQKAIDEKFGCAIESDAEVNRKRANCDPSLKTNAEDQDTTCLNKFQHFGLSSWSRYVQVNKNSHESKNTRRTQNRGQPRSFQPCSEESSSDASLRERQWARMETPVKF
jgi:hypothetical protein